DDADPGRVRPPDPESGVGHGLPRGDEGHLRVTIVAVGLDAVGQLVEVEALDTPGDLGAVSVERQVGQLRPALQGRDAGATGERVSPERLDADADGRDHAETCDDDPLAHWPARRPRIPFPYYAKRLAASNAEQG